MREAGIALADAQGREAGSVARFQPEQDRKALARRADLESDLFQAITAGDIALLFQPQADLVTGRITGVEALVRWDHPVHGRLSAATLLETAASLDLAVELGRHIRSRAIALAAGWRGALAGLKLSINVTAADLADPQFIDTLAQDLARAGLDPRRLVVEVTEDAIINDMDAAAATLSLLRRDGVGIALDDFGAGYSSLARLARLPVDLLKLDRVFAQCLNGSRRERIVVEGMITTACRLGLTVVAEGIEDDVQLEAARAAGCHIVQGYRVAPPLDADALAAFCLQHHSNVA
jgi:EAL domain-containing protein (putative c-di-GMP-specific phosphodiesterase class I)